ncbi:hypothetical protein ACFQL1_04740 [Halomicroarcula sp. GCM10025709]|uniref:DUF7521 family protein n=1 Tax=Haloarcula TaxID=2237 RepID=UPI0024C33DE3|nr:hypothetical protein [Halomicroarcula sp. YJ-61-S]
MVALGSLVDVLTGAAATGSAIIGLYIGAHAYRGLRRHGDPSMRYLSMGMILLFGVTYLVALLGQGLIASHVVGIRYQGAFRLVVRLLQFAGLGLIAYSLRLATDGGALSR